jgi:allantoin racemase
MRKFRLSAAALIPSAGTGTEDRMRLLLINANTTQAITDRCAAAARRAAAPGTEIVGVTATRGPRVIGTAAENEAAESAVLELLAAHGGKCDAALIAVSFDTALDAARKAASIPVLGMTEAALHTAATLGARIGFIGPGLHTRALYEATIARSGLAGRIAGYRALDMQAQDFANPSATVAPAVRLANELVEQDGADSVVVAGAALAGLTTEVQAGVPVPVVDGIAAGTALAEVLVRLRRNVAAART